MNRPSSCHDTRDITEIVPASINFFLTIIHRAISIIEISMSMMFCPSSCHDACDIPEIIPMTIKFLFTVIHAAVGIIIIRVIMMFHPSSHHNTRDWMEIIPMTIYLFFTITHAAVSIIVITFVRSSFLHCPAGCHYTICIEIIIFIIYLAFTLFLHNPCNRVKIVGFAIQC